MTAMSSNNNGSGDSGDVRTTARSTTTALGGASRRCGECIQFGLSSQQWRNRPPWCLSVVFVGEVDAQNGCWSPQRPRHQHLHGRHFPQRQGRRGQTALRHPGLHVDVHDAANVVKGGKAVINYRARPAAGAHPSLQRPQPQPLRHRARAEPQGR